MYAQTVMMVLGARLRVDVDVLQIVVFAVLGSEGVAFNLDDQG